MNQFTRPDTALADCVLSVGSRGAANGRSAPSVRTAQAAEDPMNDANAKRPQTDTLSATFPQEALCLHDLSTESGAIRAMTLHALQAYADEQQAMLPPIQSFRSCDARRVTVVLDEFELHSAFQGIYTARTGQPFGYEALLRALDKSGKTLTPPDVLKASGNAFKAASLERLCRATHVAAFAMQLHKGCKLFLNVDGNHLTDIAFGDSSALLRLLARCGVEPGQIVLEILESRISDPDKAARAAAACRGLGYRIALDDFGIEHSNFDRLWRLKPDIVKLDRSLIIAATAHQAARRAFAKLIEIAHELGAQVVGEGIETASQHEVATACGSDLVQGYLYSRPRTSLPSYPTHDEPG